MAASRSPLSFIATLLLAIAAGSHAAKAAFQPSGQLEIHYINVGQGGSTLIIGPNGTRILYDFGKVNGAAFILPYLREIGIEPEDGLDYTIVSHRDRDHYFGYRGVIAAGYDVHVANFAPDEDEKESKLIGRQWLDPAKDTTAGEVLPIPVGLRIALGDGAEAIVVAASGKIMGREAPIAFKDENDRSVVLFVNYKDFQFILDGDLGGGKESCTGHQTRQKDIQTPVATALLALGIIDAEHGVDVMHVAHHGSESSTPARYFELVRPEVAMVSVGMDQTGYWHPREDVVDRVLLHPDRSACFEEAEAEGQPERAKPVYAVFQTEDGDIEWIGDEVRGRCTKTGCVSLSGLPLGDIALITDGLDYWIDGSARVAEGSRVARNRAFVCAVDERLEANQAACRVRPQ